MNWFLFATCSALLSAGAAIIQKKVLSRIHALEFSFLLSLAIFTASLPIPFFTDITSLSSIALFLLLGKSILGGCAFLLVMISLEKNPISSALPLLGITPAVTALLAVPFLQESLHIAEWIGIALMVAGTYLLEKRPAQTILQPFRLAFFSRTHYSIFGAVLLFAVSSLLDKSLLSHYRIDPSIILFYQHAVYCLLFAFFLIFRRVSFRALFRSGRNQIVFIAGIALITLAYRFTQLEATILAPVALVLAVKRTSILYASFFGGKLFSEEYLLQKLLGAALIVASGFLILRNVA